VEEENLLVSTDGRLRYSRRLADRYNLCIDSFGLHQERPHEQSPTKVAFSLAKLGRR
jgi:hypothetical protein